MSDQPLKKELIVSYGNNDVVIAINEKGLISMNDLHKAFDATCNPSKSPRKWRTLKDVKEMERVHLEMTGTPMVEAVNGGADRGTYIVPEMVVAYAQWLSPAYAIGVSYTMHKYNTYGYVVADRWYNVADIIRMYRRRNGEVYSDPMEPLEGHNDIGYYADGTTEEQYEKIREIGKMRLHRLSHRQYAHPDKYYFVVEGGDPGENEDGPYYSWCASRYYFVRVDEVYNLIDMLFGEELGHFSHEWRNREAEMLQGIPRYRKASLQDGFMARQLAMNLNKPPLLTWDSWGDYLNSDEDMPA